MDGEVRRSHGTSIVEPTARESCIKMISRSGPSSEPRRKLMFTRKFLRGWWSRALRRKILFSALDHSDRGYLYLTMKAFDEIRDAEVGKIIVKILAKLRDALESPFARKVETYGVMKARQLSRVAVEWGYDVAQQWANETGYIEHLTNNELNTPQSMVYVKK